MKSRVLPAFSVAILLAALVACGQAGPNAAPSPTPVAQQSHHPAVRDFWAAFQGDDYDALETVIEGLSAARTAEPEDPEIEFIWAHAHLWKVAEWARRPERPTSGQAAVVAEAVRAFERAAALRPSDARIPCWLGLLELQTGRLFEDPDLMDRGARHLAETTAAFPEFGHFCEILAYWDQPRDSADFARAIEAGWLSVDVCLDEPIDRSHPDATPYLSQATLQGPRRVCWNGSAAPHNEEGYWLVMGDLFTRAGQREVALQLYENARLRSESFDTWRYADLLEDRISTLDERLIAFGDDDPANDPELLPSNAGCVVCHAH